MDACALAAIEVDHAADPVLSGHRKRGRVEHAQNNLRLRIRIPGLAAIRFGLDLGTLPLGLLLDVIDELRLVEGTLYDQCQLMRGVHVRRHAQDYALHLRKWIRPDALNELL